MTRLPRGAAQGFVGGDTSGGIMGKGKAGAARGDGPAGEAWAAGCRDVQAAINWAATKGLAAGAPFQAAFRRLLAAQDAAPPAATPVPAVAASTTDVGRDRGRRRTPARPEPEPAAAGRPRRPPARPKPEVNGQAVGDPAPAPAQGAGAAHPTPSGPAEFVDDLRALRHLLTKYGKKGLADLVHLLGG